MTFERLVYFYALQGFIYILSVIDGDENAPSARSGLSKLHREATISSRLLVISRVSNQKVLPWIVSSTGAIRCYDTVSLSQKLSLHRHAKVPILLHVFLWERTTNSPMSTSIGPSHSSTVDSVHSSSLGQERQADSNRTQSPPVITPNKDIIAKDVSQFTVDRDTAGEISFRFHDFLLPNTWV